MKIIFKKYAVSVIITIVLFLTYSLFVIIPKDFKSYSLIDDGQTYLNSIYLKGCISGNGCGEFINKAFFEKEYNRFRPTYWIIQSVNESITQNNPSTLHQLRVFGYGFVIVAVLIAILVLLSVSPVSIPFLTMLFIVNPSYTENIVRLGPIEPYIVLFLGLFYLTFLKKESIIWPLIFGILLITLKETTAVFIVSAALVAVFARKKNKIRDLILLFAIPLAVYLLGRLNTLGANVYTNSYNISKEVILRNSQLYASIYLNYFGPFIKLILLSLPLFLIKGVREKLQTKQLAFWVMVAGSSALVLLPWEYVLDRYILPTAFSLVIVIGLAMTPLIEYGKDALNKYKQIKYLPLIYLALIIFILSNMYFRIFPVTYAKSVNYRNWYSEFLKFENEQLTALTKLPDGSVVYVNAKEELGNWEVYYELPIHMKHIYHKEIEFRRLDSTKIIRGNIIFSRSILSPVVDTQSLGKKLKTVNNASYETKQIDPLLFRNMFVENTLGSLLNPPIGDVYKMYWSIDKVQ